MKVQNVLIASAYAANVAYSLTIDQQHLAQQTNVAKLPNQDELELMGKKSKSWTWSKGIEIGKKDKKKGKKKKGKKKKGKKRKGKFATNSVNVNGKEIDLDEFGEDVTELEFEETTVEPVEKRGLLTAFWKVFHSSKQAAVEKITILKAILGDIDRIEQEQTKHARFDYEIEENDLKDFIRAQGLYHGGDDYGRISTFGKGWLAKRDSESASEDVTSQGKLGDLKDKFSKNKDMEEDDDCPEDKNDKGKMGGLKDKLKKPDIKGKMPDMKGKMSGLKEKLKKPDIKGKMPDIKGKLKKPDIKGKIPDIKGKLKKPDIKGKIPDVKGKLKMPDIKGKMPDIKSKLGKGNKDDKYEYYSLNKLGEEQVQAQIDLKTKLGGLKGSMGTKGGEGKNGGENGKNNEGSDDEWEEDWDDEWEDEETVQKPKKGKGKVGKGKSGKGEKREEQEFQAQINLKEKLGELKAKMGGMKGGEENGNGKGKGKGKDVAEEDDEDCDENEKKNGQGKSGKGKNGKLNKREEQEFQAQINLKEKLAELKTKMGGMKGGEENGKGKGEKQEKNDKYSGEKDAKDDDCENDKGGKQQTLPELPDFSRKGNNEILSKREIDHVVALHDLRDILNQNDFAEGVSKRDVVDQLLARVFVSLKRSGLINNVIRMSLTDAEVRESLTSITIDLLRAEVIPWEEVFIALRDSGLAVDVVRFSMTDEETRSGLGEFVKELLPELLESGAIEPKDIIGGEHKVVIHEFREVHMKRDDNVPIEGAVPITHPTPVV